VEGRFEDDDRREFIGFRRGAFEVSVAGTWVGVTGCLVSDVSRQRNHINFMLATPLCTYNHKGETIPVHAWAGPEGSRKLRLPDFQIFGTRSW
jgi:hypothetical protein